MRTRHADNVAVWMTVALMVSALLAKIYLFDETVAAVLDTFRTPTAIFLYWATVPFVSLLLWALRRFLREERRALRATLACAAVLWWWPFLVLMPGRGSGGSAQLDRSVLDQAIGGQWEAFDAGYSAALLMLVVPLAIGFVVTMVVRNDRRAKQVALTLMSASVVIIVVGGYVSALPTGIESRANDIARTRDRDGRLLRQLAVDLEGKGGEIAPDGYEIHALDDAWRCDGSFGFDDPPDGCRRVMDGSVEDLDHDVTHDFNIVLMKSARHAAEAEVGGSTAIPAGRYVVLYDSSYSADGPDLPTPTEPFRRIAAYLEERS